MVKRQLKKSVLIGKSWQVKSTSPRQLRVKSTVVENEEATTSGGGMPGELIQRTISRDVHIDYERGCIGRGRYGTVWLGKWNGDPVAVKVFFSMHENSWSRETQIYQTSLLRHENILGHIASDILGIGCSVNMLLITDYHQLGSLYDYLQANTVDKVTFFKLVRSIADGLNHLHQEIFSSTNYKPSIVHRDLKTKNVLVKRDLQCCLADFGMSVRFDSQLNRMDTFDCGAFPVNVRQGSVRYMAPECLNDQLNVNSISDLKKTDIYSFSLIMWECLSRLRLESDQIVHEHRPPYQEYVTGEPSVQLMRELVCFRQIRPRLDGVLESLSTSSKHIVTIILTTSNLDFQFFDCNLPKKDIRECIEVMMECWNHNPNERLTSLNVKKKLKRLSMLNSSEHIN